MKPVNKQASKRRKETGMGEKMENGSANGWAVG
jgi:hypothetical protein